MFVPPIALSGRPTVREPRNAFADEGAGTLAPGVDEDRPLVYVPHNRSGDVWEIDPASYQVVAKYPAGREMQHVVPSYDMRTLRPLNSMSAPSVADTIAGADSRTA